MKEIREGFIEELMLWLYFESRVSANQIKSWGDRGDVMYKGPMVGHELLRVVEELKEGSMGEIQRAKEP